MLLKASSENLMWLRGKKFANTLLKSRNCGTFYFKIFWKQHTLNLSLPSFKTSRVRLRARTPPFHGGDTGSNPVRGTHTKQDSFTNFAEKIRCSFLSTFFIFIHLFIARSKQMQIIQRFFAKSRVIILSKIS